jgi:allantoate deiminase
MTGQPATAALDLTVDPAVVRRSVAELARHGAHHETGVWRPVYSPAWSAAQDCVAGWGRDAGLEVRRDAVGNLWIELPGTEQGGLIATGSHIDSQLPGGRFDGALGVIAGVLAVTTLARRCGRPRRTLAAVSFCEEESSRFAAGMWGSRVVSGAATDHDADRIRDADGISLATAMRQVGLDPPRIAAAARSDIETFIELHIEQGPLLEEVDASVGIVTSITGIRHYQVELTGRADHAGARPIDDRRDALLGAAEIVVAVGAAARAAGRPAVATVGRLSVEPNLAAAVAERARLTIDVRHPDPEALRRLAGRCRQVVDDIAHRHGLAATLLPSLYLPPTACAPRLVRLLADAAAAQGLQPPMLHSGAAHDAQRIADIADVAMLFVRSRDGRSHTPVEFTSTADATVAIETLIGALHRLAY